MDTFLQIAEEIKKGVSDILMSAVNGSEHKYRTEDGFIRWGLVEKDIHREIEYQLTADSTK